MITVFTMWRSASTNYVDHLHKLNPDHIQHGELFHEQNTTLDTKGALKRLSKEKKFIVKIFPWHMKVREPGLTERILEITDKPIFLIRKNLDDAIQSYYIAKYMFKYGITWHEEWLKPIKIEYDRDLYSKYVSAYEQELYWLADLYNSLDNKQLVWSEDFMQESSTSKYRRPVIWDRNPGFCNIDCEELFY